MNKKKKKRNNVTKQKQKDKEWSDRISRHNALKEGVKMPFRSFEIPLKVFTVNLTFFACRMRANSFVCLEPCLLWTTDPIGKKSLSHHQIITR